MTAYNPFIFGRPVKGDEFFDRETELHAIIQRLIKSEATALVGEPHVGKTSLLLKLNNKAIIQQYFGDYAKRLIFSYIDLLPIDVDYSPQQFWTDVLTPLEEQLETDEARQQLNAVIASNFEQNRLGQFINYLANMGYTLALLLDEFDRLLVHPNFQTSSFYALLRSLSSISGGMTFVTASRLSVKEMNEIGRKLLSVGSPLFNIAIEIRLNVFDDFDIYLVLKQADKELTLNDRYFIQRVAGGNPFLLQAMAGTLLETPATKNRYEKTAEVFYERVSYHFDDLWHTLNDRTRTTAVILSLMELGGRALGQKFSYGDIERVAQFGPELENLKKLGIAQMANEAWRFDRKHLLLWRGEEWTVSAQAFIWWIRDVVVSETRSVQLYSDWLKAKHYSFLLTQGQWDTLLGLVRNLPDWAIKGVGGFAHTLFEEIAGKK